MSGETLNYYYFGHLVLAWPIKLLGIRPDAGYLLLWGVLMGLTATAVYAFAGTLWAAARTALGERAPRGGPVFAGIVAAALVTILGNLAGVRSWVNATDPPKDYAWFDPSRVIPNTINEFPSFSFVLGDLHAHVIALPFTVLVVAFGLQLALTGPRGDLLWRGAAEALAAALALGVMYAMNSWSYPVCAGLLAAGLVIRMRTDGRVGFPIVWMGLVLVASFALILPFVFNFSPESQRDRRGRRQLRAGHGVRAAPQLQVLARRHGADLRDPAVAADRALRRAAAGLAEALAVARLGWRGGGRRRVAAGVLEPDRARCCWRSGWSRASAPCSRPSSRRRSATCGRSWRAAPRCC